MNPITPQRFIELLDKDFYVSLWHKQEEKSIGYRAIGKPVNYGKDLQWVAIRYESGIDDNLSELYESKPETPLDELDNILDNSSTAYMRQVDSIKTWRDEYESQLKELKS